MDKSQDENPVDGNVGPSDLLMGSLARESGQDFNFLSSDNDLKDFGGGIT